MTDLGTNNLEKQEILVVDDTPASLQLLTGILTENGYLVRPASSGRLALRSVAARIPDLILLDIKMLDMDGYEVCRQLKNDSRSSQIPVIFLSALGETTEKIKGFNVGGVDYITKPFEPEEVLARVRTHMQLRELTEKLEQKVLERTIDLEESNRHLKQEIIERKKAEEDLLFKNIILSTQQEVSLDGILVVDEESRIISYNQRFLDIWDVPPEIMEDENDEYLLQFVMNKLINPEEFLKRVKKLYTSRNEKSREEIAFKNGRIFDRYSSPMFGSDGRYFGRVWFFRDITESKQAAEALRKSELELRHLNEELEMRVKSRTLELENANIELTKIVVELKQTQAQLVESEKMAALGSLVAGVAHEINTPVGIGVTAASHLNDKVKAYQKMYENESLKRKDFEEMLLITSQSSSLVLSNLNRAIELISSFKQVAVDQSSGEQRNFNVEKYIHEILLSLHYKLKKKKHQIKVNCPLDLMLNSYPSAFYQIFTNLILNSITHGFDENENGTISIEIELKDDRAYIVFSDDGKGIAEENLKRIFEPFYTTRRNIGGSGLGLHIVYNLVTQTLKGRIKCESIPDGGTSFFIDFPVSEEEEHAISN